MEVYLQFMAFAWQNDYYSLLCHGIYVRTLITLNYIFNKTFFYVTFFYVTKHFLCCLLKKGENRKKKKTEKVLVPFWYIIFSLCQLNLEGKKCNSLWPFCPIVLKDRVWEAGVCLDVIHVYREYKNVKCFNHCIWL